MVWSLKQTYRRNSSNLKILTYLQVFLRLVASPRSTTTNPYHFTWLSAILSPTQSPETVLGMFQQWIPLQVHFLPTQLLPERSWWCFQGRNLWKVEEGFTTWTMGRGNHVWESGPSGLTLGRGCFTLICWRRSPIVL